MSRDELATMDGNKCILQLRGVRPFFSDKYDVTRHPNYRYTAEADPKRTFNIQKFVKSKATFQPDDICEIYEINFAE